MRSRQALIGACLAMAGLVQAAGPPPNGPATVEWDAQQGRISLNYHGSVILDARVVARDPGGKETSTGIVMQPTVKTGEQVEQRLSFRLAKPQTGVELILRGVVTGSEEAFPAEMLSGAQKRFPYVRNSVGLSRNLRNNAVYDRHWDWVLVGPPDTRTRITLKRKAERRISFSWESRGSGESLELDFRPRFYQKHKGLKHYRPWTYTVWKDSVSGYCSWWAYKGGFNQEKLDAVVDVFAAKNLRDFGYRYMQIDDCFQSGTGPSGWLNWQTRKFPGGAEGALKKIRAGGFEGGIWIFSIYKHRDVAKEHPEWFVQDAEGKPYEYRGGQFGINANNKEALETLVRPTHRGVKKLGFTYVKVDATQHLLNDYYRKCPEHFQKMKADPDLTLRKYFHCIREELGPDTYVLNCLGVRPEVIGLVGGSRLGGDGFNPQLFKKYNSWNGVVWRNDPDHCDIRPKYHPTDAAMPTFGVKRAPVDTIVRPCIVSMAGGSLMVSDLAEVYKNDANLEGMKRSAPVLFTVPGQLYDVSQSGGRSPWWLLEIDRSFDHWSVLARFQWGERKDKGKLRGAPAQEIKFADLGLADDREYMVFEFWSQVFLGDFKETFTAPAQDANNGLQVFAIREVRTHPWILSTTRHISQGGVSLRGVHWNGEKSTLSGTSTLIAGDPYVLTVHLPDGFRLAGVEAGGEKTDTNRQGHTAAIRITPSATKTADWKITFTK